MAHAPDGNRRPSLILYAMSPWRAAMHIGSCPLTNSARHTLEVLCREVRICRRLLHPEHHVYRAGERFPRLSVDMLHLHRGCDIPDGLIDDYVAPNWLEWNGGALRDHGTERVRPAAQGASGLGRRARLSRADRPPSCRSRKHFADQPHSPSHTLQSRGAPHVTPPIYWPA